MEQTNYVLKNQDGEIIRRFNTSTYPLFLIQDSRTQRVRLLCKEEFIEIKNESVLIKEIDQTLVSEKKPYLINKNLLLALATDSDPVETSTAFAEDDLSTFKRVLGWTTLSHISLLALALLTSFIFSVYFKKEVKIVTVIPHKEQKITVKKIKKQTIKISKIKPIKRKNKKYKVTKRVKKVRSVPAKRQRRMGGALGILSQLKIPGKNNVNLGSINAKKSANRSRRLKGGHSRVVYGKGLIASKKSIGKSLGNNDHYSSYGTYRGAKGYGKMRFRGQGNGEIQPLTQESIVAAGLTKDQIDAIIRRNSGQIIYCYEKGLQQKQNIKGRVSINFLINSSGKVKMARVNNSSLNSSSVEKCVLGKLRKFQFPQPVGNVNVKVSYPFIFRRVRG